MGTLQEYIGAVTYLHRVEDLLDLLYLILELVNIKLLGSKICI
jgi:hypothetical protein